MALYNFHRVLITAAILFFFIYSLWALRHEGQTNLIMGVAALVISVAMVAYLVYFNYRIRVLKRGY